MTPRVDPSTSGTAADFVQVVFVALAVSAARMPQWTALLRCLEVVQAPEVQEAARAALLPTARLLAALSGAAAHADWGDDGGEAEARRVQRALFLRVRADLLAIEVLLRGDESRRVAAGLCRSVYEGSLWIRLLHHRPARASHYVRWHEVHLAGRATNLLSQCSEVLRRRAGAENHHGAAVSLDAFRDAGFLAALVNAQRDTQAAEKAALAAAGAGSGKKEVWPPSARGLARLDSVEPELPEMVWHHLVYEPACRLLHVADALDFIEYNEIGGGERSGSPLDNEGLQPEAVVAAALLHLLASICAPGVEIFAELADQGLDEAGVWADDHVATAVLAALLPKALVFIEGAASGAAG